MSQSENSKFAVLENHNDIEHSQTAKSKFLFHLFFLGFFLFMGGCGYALWDYKYRTTADQPVPESTNYNPKYK